MQQLTPAEGIELYLDDKQTDAAQATIRSHESRLGHFEEWCTKEGIKHLSELDPIDMHRYKQWRSEDVNKVTLKTQLDTLRVCMKYCARTLNCVQDDIPDAILSPSLSDSDARDELLEPDIATELLSHLEKYSYGSIEHVIMLLCYRCLLRRGGMRALDIRDCDLDTDTPVIRVRHRPETGTPLKNKAGGERTISLTPDTRDTLSDYLDDNRHDVTDHGRQPLLATQHGRMHTQTIQAIVYGATRPCIVNECPHGRDKRECDAARNRHKAYECPSTVGPHSTRRGAITHWLDSDVPVKAVSDRCNTDPSVIEKHYDERTERSKAEQRRKYLDQV